MRSPCDVEDTLAVHDLYARAHPKLHLRYKPQLVQVSIDTINQFGSVLTKKTLWICLQKLFQQNDGIISIYNIV